MGLLNIKVLPAGTGISEESMEQGSPKQIGAFKNRGGKLGISRTGSVGRIAQVWLSFGTKEMFWPHFGDNVK